MGSSTGIYPVTREYRSQDSRNAENKEGKSETNPPPNVRGKFDKCYEDVFTKSS